jgi:GNAT superfamily N-acetyltransferase
MSSKEQVRVREFEPSDLEEVRDLINRTINVCYGDFYLKEILNYFDMFHWGGNILKAARDGYTIVADFGELSRAESHGKIVATGSLAGEVILRVFVDPEHQKQGLGRMIMKELEMRASANGVQAVRLRALANARKFYESLGYRTVAQGAVEVDNGGHLEYYEMVKSLGVGQGDYRSQTIFEGEQVNDK